MNTIFSIFICLLFKFAKKYFKQSQSFHGCLLFEEVHIQSFSLTMKASNYRFRKIQPHFKQIFACEEPFYVTKNSLECQRIPIYSIQFILIDILNQRGNEPSNALGSKASRKRDFLKVYSFLPFISAGIEISGKINNVSTHK